MITRISEAYDELLDKNITVIDLWIYERLLGAEEMFGIPIEEWETYIHDIKESYYNDIMLRDLTYHIDKILYGAEGEIWD